MRTLNSRYCCQEPAETRMRPGPGGSDMSRSSHPGFKRPLKPNPGHTEPQDPTWHMAAWREPQQQEEQEKRGTELQLLPNPHNRQRTLYVWLAAVICCCRLCSVPADAACGLHDAPAASLFHTCAETHIKVSSSLVLT